MSIDIDLIDRNYDKKINFHEKWTKEFYFQSLFF